jgi:hypothetical protein
MFEQESEPANPHAFTSGTQATAESARVARDFRARAERYRRFAASLFDANIIAVVLACARELEEHADAVSRDQPDPHR